MGRLNAGKAVGKLVWQLGQEASVAWAIAAAVLMLRSEWLSDPEGLVMAWVRARGRRQDQG